MEIMTLVLLAVGLSMDAFAVSISNGFAYGNIKRKQIILIAAMFGIFQGLMPILGYFAGMAFSETITSIDHWIALVLLGVIGGKMMWEAYQESRNPKEECKSCDITFKIIFMQAIATSIDALAVGVSFAALDVNIFSGAILIALITFVFCLFGGIVGRKFNDLFASKATFFGGLILVLLGLKIFFEHMVI